MLSKLLHCLDDMQAMDIKVIDVRNQTTITDYMVVASGRSSRHVKSIGQKMLEDMKQAKYPSFSCAGLDSGDWVLIDFGDVILHIMQPDSRQYYNIEGLWEGHAE